MPSPTQQKNMKKKVKKYSWKEISRAVQEIYDRYHHRDSWNVRVIYQESMMYHLKRILSRTRKKK